MDCEYVRILRITVDLDRVFNSKRWICDSFHDRGWGASPESHIWPAR